MYLISTAAVSKTSSSYNINIDSVIMLRIPSNTVCFEIKWRLSLQTPSFNQTITGCVGDDQSWQRVEKSI